MNAARWFYSQPGFHALRPEPEPSTDSSRARVVPSANPQSDEAPQVLDGSGQPKPWADVTDAERLRMALEESCE